MDLGDGTQLSAREYNARRRARDRARLEARRQQTLLQVQEVVPQVASTFPAVHRVYLFGSLLHAGRFTLRSDIDLAVQCDDLQVETTFARALFRVLKVEIDLRPLQGAVLETVREEGELLYA